MEEIKPENDKIFRREADILDMCSKDPAAFIKTVEEKFTDEEISPRLRTFLMEQKNGQEVKETISRISDRMWLAIEIVVHFSEKAELCIKGVPVNEERPVDMDERSDFSAFKRSIGDKIKQNQIEPTTKVPINHLERGDIVCVKFWHDSDSVLAMYLSVTQKSKREITGYYHVEGRGRVKWLVSGNFSLLMDDRIEKFIWQGEAGKEKWKQWGSRSLKWLFPQIFTQIPEKVRGEFHELAISQMFLVPRDNRKSISSGGLLSRFFGKK